MTAFLADWDGVSAEPESLASFEYPSTASDYLDRYTLSPTLEMIDRFPTLTDDEVAEVLRKEAIMFAPPRMISAMDFKLRFTWEERVAIYALDHPGVKDFISILDDPRLMEVNLNSEFIRGGLDLLVTLGAITAERRDAL